MVAHYSSAAGIETASVPGDSLPGRMPHVLWGVKCRVPRTRFVRHFETLTDCSYPGWGDLFPVVFEVYVAIPPTVVALPLKHGPFVAKLDDSIEVLTKETFGMSVRHVPNQISRGDTEGVPTNLLWRHQPTEVARTGLITRAA